ncbi:MAG: Calx-beta domain-containing protein [Sulfuricurvum sp.]|nr:Calx-beta domain-containing protein [Sulfuricurvum sp.]
MSLNNNTITDMGILSSEVYDARNRYFVFNADGTRIESIIVTDNATYTIIDSSDTLTDMQALLLKNESTGQFVIAFRGTEGTTGDIISDILNGVANYNPQIADARAFVQKALDNPDYNIMTSNLILTGHSLGGMLTQAIGAELKIPGYAFNPYGMERIESMPGAMSLLTALGPVGVLAQILSYDILIKMGVSAPNAEWAKNNIFTISYTDSGALNGDILSNLATSLTSGHIGTFIPLIGEDTGFIGGHSIVQMNQGIAIYNEILSRFTADTTYDTLTRAYMVNQLMGYFFSSSAFYSKDMYDVTNRYLAVDTNIFEAGASTLSFNFLQQLSASQIASQAKIDNAVIFALIRLNGFAVEGTLSSYSSLNRDNYSTMYIEDRSLLLYKMLDAKTHDIGDWFIRDMSYGITANDDGWHYDNNQIIFGADGDNLLEGNDKANKADHLFGMGGDDYLRGNEGDDYLEGGEGNDILFGGKGYDIYASGDGDTIMDEDGKGEVDFEGMLLTGGTLTGSYEMFKTYEGDGGMYILRSDGTLIFSKNGNFLTINDYHKESNSLGIQLTGDDLELSIFAPVVREADGKATGAITLSHAYTEDVIVTLYTQDESATAGEDYVGRPTFDVRIAAGETYATFDISILNDTKKESTETFYTLVDTIRTAHGAHVDFTLTDVQPFTIEDDDTDNGGGGNPNNPTPDPIYVTVSVSDAQAVESGGTISFVVSLSEVLSKDVSIDFITQDGTAVTGSDYIQYGRYGVTIPAGQRSAVYQVVLLNDEVPEPTETFSLTPYSLSYTGPENVLFSNSATGTIYDDDPQYVSIHISDASAKERAEYMSFTVSLSKELERDITISTSLGDVTIAAGERSGNVYRTWSDDTLVEPDESFMVALTGRSYSGSEQILLLNTAIGTIIDDDPEPQPHPFPYNPATPQPHDPLVLDMNQDGEISTIALADSQVFFDITGDGVKERVGWVAPQDGLLVYDKNRNGTIDGISEVFGKDGLSGFAELRAVADTNHDNIIDRRDELYSQLKVWQDTNSDGISQANELKSLSQAGVKNIELNVIGTNINLNGNILSEAGRYLKSNSTQRKAA